MKKTSLVYMGARETTSGRLAYLYMDIETKQKVLFAKKLFKRHDVGMVYAYIRVKKGSYKVDETNNPYMPVSVWENKQEVAEWLKEEMAILGERKAKAEKSKLLKAARDSVQKLRPLYKRASIISQHEIIREIIKELEKV